MKLVDIIKLLRDEYTNHYAATATITQQIENESRKVIFKQSLDYNGYCLNCGYSVVIGHNITTLCYKIDNQISSPKHYKST